MIALLSVALNIFVLVVISYGTDHQLQSAMIMNTVHQVHKNLINVSITGKASVDNTGKLNLPFKPKWWEVPSLLYG